MGQGGRGRPPETQTSAAVSSLPPAGPQGAQAGGCAPPPPAALQACAALSSGPGVLSLSFSLPVSLSHGIQEVVLVSGPSERGVPGLQTSGFLLIRTGHPPRPCRCTDTARPGPPGTEWLPKPRAQLSVSTLDRLGQKSRRGPWGHTSPWSGSLPPYSRPSFPGHLLHLLPPHPQAHSMGVPMRDQVPALTSYSRQKAGNLCLPVISKAARGDGSDRDGAAAEEREPRLRGQTNLGGNSASLLTSCAPFSRTSGASAIR